VTPVVRLDPCVTVPLSTIESESDDPNVIMSEQPTHEGR
jgi:hypothetical protein